MSRAAVLALLASLCVGAPSASAQDAAPTARVVQKDRADGLGARLLFGDVATVESADRAFAARLRDADLGAVAVTGGSVLVLRERLVAATAALGVASDRLAWSGPATTRVDVRPVVLTGAQAVDLALRRVAEALGKDAAEARTAAVVAPEDLVAPAGRRRNAFVARLPAKGRLSGPVAVEVVAVVDDVDAGSVLVPLDVRRRGSVVVAAREIRAGATLALEDLGVETRELGDLPAETLDRPERLVGAVAARKVAPGRPVLTCDVKAKPVVLRGAEVRLRWAVGGLVVSAPGRAVGEGAPGETVEVVHLRNNKRLTGRVVDATWVEIGPAPEAGADR